MVEQSIRMLFSSAERQRKDLECNCDANTASYQDSLAAAISTYQECTQIADRISLFSTNETLEDLATGDLEYLLIDYRLAGLIQRVASGDRKGVLASARRAYERYLNQLYHYEILSTAEKRLYNDYVESPTTFSTIASKDPATRRGAKIANFKQEKELKNRLEMLAQNPAYIQQDDDAARQLQLTNVALCTHEAFQSLESLNLELEILAMAPSKPPQSLGPAELEQDYRERMGIRDKDSPYSDRLDSRDRLSTVNKGPILSTGGKPLRPFTLLENRQNIKNGVFRPGHNLPTMTIDEYLEEEKARGGIIEGGGAASGLSPEPDEDNYEKGDAETMKARDWDEYVEANPKGSGNTLNRG